MYLGKSASNGIAIGKALVIENEELIISSNKITNIKQEKDRFNKAVDKSKEELRDIKNNVLREFGDDEAKIFDAHLLVLEDPELIDRTLMEIEEKSINCEFIFNKIAKEFINIFDSMGDEYMKERASDIRDVSERVLRNLLGKVSVDFRNIKEEVILIAQDLTPSDTAIMNKEKVLGFLTNVGGRTSHTAIMARTLEIPAVVGLRDITSKVKNGDTVILDGERGEVFIKPDDATIDKYYNLKKQYEMIEKELEEYKGKGSTTLDGRKVEIVGNIGTTEDIKVLLKNDAEGVGLYRTEFLYMDRDSLPSEDVQFKAYRETLESMKDKPVVIRTLDIGGDKKLSYLKIDEEMNPFLGYRAIRLSLDKVDIFKTQLRALLRSSVYGNLKIMFPMISSLEELLKAKEILNSVKKDLDREGIKYSKDMQVGMMIEVPSAAIISDILAKHVDFFSIGTNDLIQYTTAVDRMNEKISHLYKSFNPGVLRLIKTVIDNGHKENIRVGMCGEMAGDKLLIPILLGMGLDEFSMSPVSILPARKLIRSLRYDETKELVNKVMAMENADKIEEYMKNYIK